MSVLVYPDSFSSNQDRVGPSSNQDRAGPSSNQDKVGVGLGCNKTCLRLIMIGGRPLSLLIGGKNCQDTPKLKQLFLLTGDKTEVKTWTKHSIVTSTIRNI